MAPLADPFRRVLSNFSARARSTLSDARDAEEAETVQALERSVERFSQRLVDPARIDAEARIDPGVLSAAKELGLFGMTIPQEFGGAGLSMKAACRVMRCLGRQDASVGVSIGLHNGLGLRGLIHLGTPEQKQKYLPDLAAGRKIACFSATEAGAGSEIAAIRASAVEDGDGFVLSGEKIYVTNGGFADLATVPARTPGLGGSRRGLTLFLVPLDLPGVSRGREEHKLGIKGSSTCTLHFDEVRLPRSAILGEVSRGLDHLAHILEWGRTLMAAGCIGLMQNAWEKTLFQVTNRKQFGRVIGEFGMVREKLAAMRSRLHALESAMRLSTALDEEGSEGIPQESLVLKLACTEWAFAAADEAVQLHGGSGFIEETGVARLLRDVRITRIFEGANEVLRFHLASAAFAWDAEALSHSRLAPLVDDTLRPEAERFDGLLQALAAALAAQKKTFGIKVFVRQMAQRRIASATTALYLSLCVLARAQGEMAAGSADDALLDLTRLVLGELAATAQVELSSFDEARDALASRIAARECERAGCALKEKT
ncbi:MAG: hypothetical protein GYA21_15970, partial [Myxococcales bacterium]|nr:hypothetical protein [Myxococcales bacterium]